MLGYQRTTSSVTVDNVTVDVWCSMSWLPFSVTAQNRNITYSACVVPVNPTPTDPVPTATSCAAAPLLQALVSFDDPPGPGGGPSPSPARTGTVHDLVSPDLRRHVWSEPDPGQLAMEPRCPVGHLHLPDFRSGDRPHQTEARFR